MSERALFKRDLLVAGLLHTVVQEAILYVQVEDTGRAYSVAASA